MGLSRVFRRSIRFTFRSKRRFLVFMVIFAIISTLIALNIDNLDTLTTDDLLDQKGITVKRIEGVDIPYDLGKTLYDQILDIATDTSDFNIEASAMYSYIDIDASLRLHSFDISNPWISEFIKPSFIQEGRFPSAPNEILVPTGSFQQQSLIVDSTEYLIQSDLAIGQVLTFTQGESEIELEVVGTFDDQQYEITNLNDGLWLFMDNVMFEDVLELFSLSLSDTLVYSEAFIVEGVILQQDTYEAANSLKEEITLLLEGNESIYGDWQDVPAGALPLKDTKDASDQILLTIGFVVIGGVILSTLFSYLISRFRRREIAILKAMGYSHNSVRMSLFAEILTTSLSGFILGLSIAQGYLLYDPEGIDFSSLIRAQAMGVSFLIMVIVSLPGMWFASRRILSVSPAEAFRAN